MGKILIPGSFGGGVTSDDVTAKREHVLQGYTALTADSDDEVVEGTIQNRGNGMVAVDFTNAHWESKFVARMEQGYYSQIGQWKPYVSIPYAVLANIAGIDANKMLDTLTIAGVRGTIPIYGAWNVASEVINATWENPKKIYFRFKKGYYLEDGQYPPSVSATYKDIANAVGIRANKILDDENILGTQGTIPRWICTTGGVITALNGEGFVWDDNSGANRGRGIVARIPDKHFIQDASYVFLGSPNLYPQNVVKNVNINGVTGARNWIDNIGEQMIAQNVEISMLNRNQAISLGNAYANSETVFFGVETVGEDVWDGFVRRDKGNGRYLIGRIPVSKNDGNLLGTFIRNAPVQIEIVRDNAGNISLIHHGPNQVLGATKLNVYIYAHSSISFRF